MFKLLSASIITLLSVFNPIMCDNIIDVKFANFVSEHNKQYQSSDEYHYRMRVFSENIKYIDEINSQNRSYTLSINQFADLTNSEFKSRFTPMKKINKSQVNNTNYVNYVTLPTALDWRIASQNPKNLVAVTAVKNQQQCGSCWSFSASGATEGAWAISGKNLVSLSEQQLVDCSSSYGNNGCNGGDMDAAFQYIHDNGLCTEASYPYKASQGTCQKCTAVAHLNGYTDISNEAGILPELQKGPVSIGLEADQSVFQFYNGGVLDDVSCGTQLDHGVLIVGYGTDASKDYWIVKNSWGAQWGESGYIRIVRNKGMCGIGQMQSRPYYTNQADPGSTLDFNWDLLWQCVGECGGDIIKDIISCAGDLTHIWDILNCVAKIVGTVSPCYKCIKGILG
jgi:cathepsin L